MPHCVAGTVQRLVISAAHALGIPVDLQPPKIDQARARPGPARPPVDCDRFVLASRGRANIRDGWMGEARYGMPRRTAAQAGVWREAFITSTSRLALPIRELRLVEAGAQV